VILTDSALPGAEILAAGLSDLERGAATSSALAVLVVARRLRQAGIDVPTLELDASPELTLYAQLNREEVRDPYGTYNSLLRRLGSLASCLELEKFRKLRTK
jgi:hypothetical protein